MQLIRAITLTWLFSGLRSDEITRLRVGAIRWQRNGVPIPGDAPDVLADAKISPKTLTRAYTDAGYFSRNVRTVEVLIDRDVVEAGTAASGQPCQHYDLGHRYCSYTFFEQCPHRMTCARCDFYIPKDSTKAQLLEARGNLQKMVTAIPLTDDERAAVDDGQAALDRLLDRLADIPAPAGPTPRQLDLPQPVRLLPILEVRQRQPDGPLTVRFHRMMRLTRPFDRAGALGQGQPGGDGLEIPVQAGGERAQGCGSVGVDPLHPVAGFVAAALGKDLGELAD